METKEIKLNSYTLLDDSIEKMKDALHISRRDKKEVGLTMCSSKDDVIVLREQHAGENQQVFIKRQCNEGEKYVGYYHTHHKGTSKASSGDLRLCGTSKILCIGGKEDQGEQRNDSVRCYTWKGKVIPVEEGAQLLADVRKGKKRTSQS